jgi:hypothetical protein
LVLPTLFFVSVLIFGIQQLQPSSVPAELFGADRCTFEGNFPVENVGTGYATQWNAFKRIAASRLAGTEACALRRHRAPGSPAR